MNAHGPRAWWRRALMALVAAGAATAWTGPASAQVWSVDARVGQLRSEAGPGLESSTAMLVLRRVAGDALLALSGGVPLRSEEPLWGGLSTWKRVAAEPGRFTLGLDLSGDLFAQHDPAGQEPVGGGFGDDLLGRGRPLPPEPLTGWAGTASAMPLAGVDLGDFEVEARVGAATYLSDFAGTRFERTVRQGDARLSWSPALGTSLSLTGRHVRADEGRYDRAGVALRAMVGSVSLNATAGRWAGHEDMEGPEWSASVHVPLTGGLSLGVSARRTVFDPLRLAPPRTSWGVGFGWAFGGPARPAPPVPSRYHEGRATIEVAAKDVGASPRIAGDFNDWVPAPMERAGTRWRYTVALEPGVYNYAFVAADGTWFVPESVAGRKTDGFGGHVAVLVVEEP